MQTNDQTSKRICNLQEAARVLHAAKHIITFQTKAHTVRINHFSVHLHYLTWQTSLPKQLSFLVVGPM
jgi:uncharacterized integral membrane protein